MPKKHTKPIIVICLVLCFGTIACLVGYMRLNSFFNMLEVGGNGQAPIRSLRITIDKEQRGQIFDLFQKFAEKHGFEYQITDFEGTGVHFQYWMSRDDIKIIASNPFEEEKFRIRFYAKYPSYPVDESVVNDLVDDLKTFLLEIEGVKIIEE